MAMPNYTIESANPFGAMQQGYTLGAGIRDDQFKQQQQQVALQQQQQQRQVIQSLLANKNATADDYANASVIIPGMKDQFKQAWEMKNTAQQQSILSDASQWFPAIVGGNPTLAADQMKSRADAMESAGAPAREVGAIRAMSQTIREHPEFARLNMGLFINSIPGGDKIINGANALGAEQRAQALAPGELAKVNAEAGIKTVEAANAPTKTALDNQAAVNKARIDDLNVQISQANSETQRGQLILERDKLSAVNDVKSAEKGDAAQSQVDSAQHALNTITDLRKSPLMKATAGNWAAGMGTVLGQLMGMVPGTENKDFRGQLESLKSQIFLPAVQQIKGMGALSNAEGEKLTAAIAALDANMSPKAFENALGVVERYMTKGLQKGLATKAVPVQGGGFVLNHPQFGAVKEGDINRLMKENPGATREQVLQYLSQTGGK